MVFLAAMLLDNIFKMSTICRNIQEEFKTILKTSSMKLKKILFTLIKQYYMLHVEIV